MQIREWSGWEDITSHSIHSHGGGGMIEQYYRNSLRKVAKQTMNPFQLYFNSSSLRNLNITHVQALEVLYPEYAPSREGMNVPSVLSHRSYFDQYSRENGLQRAADWYQVKASNDIQSKGSSILQIYYSNSLYRALQVRPSSLLRWFFF